MLIRNKTFGTMPVGYCGWFPDEMRLHPDYLLQIDKWFVGWGELANPNIPGKRLFKTIYRSKNKSPSRKQQGQGNMYI